MNANKPQTLMNFHQNVKRSDMRPEVLQTMRQTLKQWSKHSRFCQKHFGKYVSPNGFCNWNQYIERYAINTSPQGMEKLAQINHPMSTDAAFMMLLNSKICSDLPAVYLTKELGAALSMTKVQSMPVQKMPYEAFIIMVPEGMLIGDEGEKINAILCTTSENIKKMMDTFIGFTNKIPEKYLDLARKAIFDRVNPSSWLEGLSGEKAGVFAFGLSWDECTLFHSWQSWRMPTENLKIPDNLEEQFEVVDRCSDLLPVEEVKDWKDWLAGKHALSANSADVNTQMMQICKNVIMIYNYKQSLVTTQNLTPSGQGFKRQAGQRKALPITWLGQDFRFQTVPSTFQNSSGKNDGLSPAAHWRRGHWHTFLHGKGKKERKIQWVEPVYVNADL